MKLEGAPIAERIIGELSQKVLDLKRRGITPTLAVILVGEDPASISYIRQKQMTAERIGAHVIVNRQAETLSAGTLTDIINRYNGDETTHGIIIQRPLPGALRDAGAALPTIARSKDVDGFLADSPFTPPVALAVLEFLREVFAREKTKGAAKEQTFDAWLRNQCSVIFGRGETAGVPIAKVLETRGCTIEIVHSQTPNPKSLMEKFNIVVACVGKERLITRRMVTPRTILIGVGLWRDSVGKLHGDYEEEEVADVVAYYTPTPGGVGPVNVAALMQNLVKACTMVTGGTL